MKSQITIQKGTQTLEVEIGIPNWSGDLFLAHQEELMATLPTNTIINTKRGTVGIKASEYPKSVRKLPSRLRISSARGTKIITL